MWPDRPPPTASHQGCPVNRAPAAWPDLLGAPAVEHALGMSGSGAPGDDLYLDLMARCLTRELFLEEEVRNVDLQE